MEPFDGDNSSRQVQASLTDKPRDNTRGLFNLFDSLIGYGYSTLDLFEMSSPGASEALRAWAFARGLSVTEKNITPPGAPAMVQLKVSLRAPSGGDGVQLTVLRYSEAA